MLAPADLPPDEARRLEDRDVVRYAGERHRQGRCEVRDAGIAGPQALEQYSPGGIRERGIGTIEARIFKHALDNTIAVGYSDDDLNIVGASGAERSAMPIYQTAEYRVAASGVDEVKQAIREFVGYVRDHEAGTQMYAAWQRQDDPTRFVHLFIFQDENAHRIHSESDAVARFEAAYRPHLVGGDVVFTDFDAIASNQG